MSFAELAQLLLPADADVQGLVADADERWQPPRATDAEVVVWGRGPLASGTPIGDAIRYAVRREAALMRLGSGRKTRVMRWRPRRLGPPSSRVLAREALLAGAVCEIGSAGPRVLDAAVADAVGAFASPVRRFTPLTGGGVLVAPDGGRFVRAGCSGGTGDPSGSADALTALASAGIDLVPRIFDRGRTLGCTWSVETRLEGRRPLVLTRPLVEEVSRFCAGLPRGGRSWAAAEADLRTVGAAFGGFVEGLAERLGPLEDVEAAGAHGDLWSANLLVRNDRLTGVVDWDAWRAEAVPGIDLVNLVVREEGLRSGKGFGELFRERPWGTPAFASASKHYWDRLGIEPTSRLLDAVGVAWWASRVARNLERTPRIVDSSGWIHRNIEPVRHGIVRSPE